MFKKIFRRNTIFELCLLLISYAAVITVFFLSDGEKDFLSLFTSLFGIVSVLCVAKGLILGQYLTVVFLSLYARLSFRADYYGECILVLCVSLPSALVAIVSWMKNPARERGKVKVNKLSKKEWAILPPVVLCVTVGVFFVLRALNTARLIVSTVSFVTSLSAAYLLIRRSEYYAVFYILNDVILIVLWSLAYVDGQNVLPGVVGYVVFLVNDGYGFVDWRRRARAQESAAKK